MHLYTERMGKNTQNLNQNRTHMKETKKKHKAIKQIEHVTSLFSSHSRVFSAYTLSLNVKTQLVCLEEKYRNH